jgi:hypothetical protein
VRSEANIRQEIEAYKLFMGYPGLSELNKVKAEQAIAVLKWVLE